MFRRVVLGMVAILLLAQLVPVDRSNPPVEADVAPPEPVKAILRRACYDCHSHETRWPWYSRVAPVSWLVRHDVTHAREHLNFSTWGSYDAEEREDQLEDIAEEVEKGEMPLWYYAALHPEAELSEADKATLREWTRTAAEGASAP